MLTPVVDEQDKIIGHKERPDITKDDIYRVSGLALFRPDRTMFIPRRNMEKIHDPGRWQPVAVAGTVDKGETYLTNIIKEAEEEIGLKITDPTLLFKRRVSADWEFFASTFAIKLDISSDDLIVDEGEFMESQWINIDTALRRIENKGYFTSSAHLVLPDIIKHYDDVPLTTLN